MPKNLFSSLIKENLCWYRINIVSGGKNLFFSGFKIRYIDGFGVLRFKRIQYRQHFVCPAATGRTENRKRRFTIIANFIQRIILCQPSLLFYPCSENHYINPLPQRPYVLCNKTLFFLLQNIRADPILNLLKRCTTKYTFVFNIKFLYILLCNSYLFCKLFYVVVYKFFGVLTSGVFAVFFATCSRSLSVASCSSTKNMFFCSDSRSCVG